MRRVVIGYGEYTNYRLAEVPGEFLKEIASRYPLALDEQNSPRHDDLIITVSVHAELNRRDGGGKQLKRVPTMPELAREIVDLGFRQASKQHHPDTKGGHEAQILLTEARDELYRACSQINDDLENVLTNTIGASSSMRTDSAWRGDIGNDDVPF